MLLTTNIILYIQQKFSRLIHVVVILHACMLAYYSTKHDKGTHCHYLSTTKSGYVSEETHPGILIFWLRWRCSSDQFWVGKASFPQGREIRGSLQPAGSGGREERMHRQCHRHDSRHQPTSYSCSCKGLTKRNCYQRAKLTSHPVVNAHQSFVANMSIE